MSRPSNFPPPFSPADYIAEPTDPADERIEVGVLIVGAGPAGLACAIRLGQLLEEHPDVAKRLGDVPVAVIEKGKQPGSHLLSGAVVDPRGPAAPRCPSRRRPRCGTTGTGSSRSPSSAASSPSGRRREER